MVQRIAQGFRGLVLGASDQAIVFALIADAALLVALGLFAYIG